MAKFNDKSHTEQVFLDKAYSDLDDRENFFINRKEADRYELLGYQDIGLTRIKIWSAKDKDVCPKCRKLHGKVITITEALEDMPIPVKNCDNNKGFCRCIYRPVVE